MSIFLCSSFDRHRKTNLRFPALPAVISYQRHCPVGILTFSPRRTSLGSGIWSSAPRASANDLCAAEEKNI
jgi:hypothetical protein